MNDERTVEMDRDTKIPGLPLTLGQVLDAQERGKVREDKDRRICTCGHPLARHNSLRGVSVCQPSRMMCGCRDAVPALEVPDTRVFLRKTTGIGEDHALVKGIVAALQAGHSVEWLIGTECSQCGAADAVPVGLRRGAEGVSIAGGSESPQATRMICSECLGRLS